MEGNFLATITVEGGVNINSIYYTQPFQKFVFLLVQSIFLSFLKEDSQVRTGKQFRTSTYNFDLASTR